MILLLAALGVILVEQFRAYQGATRDVDTAREQRAVAEDLARRVSGIENVAWNNWATDGNFFVDGETALAGAEVAAESAAFYSRRVASSQGGEADIARRMLEVTALGGRLLSASRQGARGEAGRRLAARVSDFSITRDELRERWLVNNARAQDAASARVRSATFGLIAVLGCGLLVLTALGIVLSRRLRRERKATMERLQRTAEEMSTLASTDPLTGLGNQRRFHARLGEELNAALAEHRPLAVALVDLDDFKRVNDAHGHAVGDDVLVEVSRRIDSGFARLGALTARVGGEEFAVVLPGVEPSQARAGAERARAGIERPIEGVGPVTVSIGLTSAQPGDDRVSLLRRADAALYRAKRGGKNRVVSDTDEESTGANGAGPRPDPSEAFATLRSLVAGVDDAQSIDGHSERVAAFAARLARKAGWGPHDVARLRQAALLHDVGKVVVPHSIFTKAGGLTDGERSLVAVHPAVGAEMARGALDTEQSAWVLHHHERWDGSGYPGGLAGERIPEGARILAIADAWDAMTSGRIYAGAVPFDDAMAELRACRGTQFWPRGVDLALEVGAGLQAAPA